MTIARLGLKAKVIG